MLNCVRFDCNPARICVCPGLRDCPDNTENELMYLSLSTGDVVNKVAQTNGTSEISIAHRAKEVIVYGIGWVKTAVPQKTYIAAAVGTTPDTFHQWASVYNGEGSMWGSSSVSSTGDLGVRTSTAYIGLGLGLGFWVRVRVRAT